MDIPILLNLACAFVADHLNRCQSVEEMRTTLGAVRDFTDEEEKEIERENMWAESGTVSTSIS